MKRIGITIIMIFVFSVNPVIAQKESNIWYFGIYAGLDFNSGEPVSLDNGRVSTIDGSACYSDKNSGQLLFYSDGLTVWNRLHEIMPLGTGLKGNHSCSQTVIIIPYPSHPDLYYLFTLDDDGGPDGLEYSIVDMSLQNGLGDISPGNKNVLVDSGSFSEQMFATVNASGNGFWLILHRWNSNAFYAYLINENGLNTNPVISYAGEFYTGAIGGVMGRARFHRMENIL